MVENRVKLYELLAANKLDRQEKAEQWRLAGILDKVTCRLKQSPSRSVDKHRFQARGK